MPFLALITTYTIGQDLILNAKDYKPGIYRTFEEFKYNNPSIPLDYTFYDYEELYLGGYVTMYRLDVDKKERQALGAVFGFCDGKNFYIQESPNRIRMLTSFSKIEYLGKYCYFEDIISQGTGAQLSKKLGQKIIDIETGEVSKLKKSNLTKIIADDTELLNQFQQEPRKNKILEMYLYKYIKRQQSQE